MSGTPPYTRWQTMRNRCTDQEHKDYVYYGGRGITVCEEWLNSFQAYYDYVSMLPNYGKKGYSIDRIDNDGNYEPGNVRFATVVEQRRNRRSAVLLTLGDKTQCVQAWADELGIARGTIESRIRYGWSDEEILTRPKSTKWSRKKRS